MAAIDIKEAQQRHDERAGNDKHQTRKQTTACAMPEPAQISGELLRFGAGQKGAVIQSMEEALFLNPFALINQQAMHHRDLASRTSE